MTECAARGKGNLCASSVPALCERTATGAGPRTLKGPFEFRVYHRIEEAYESERVYSRTETAIYAVAEAMVAAEAAEEEEAEEADAMLVDDECRTVSIGRHMTLQDSHVLGIQL